MNIRVDFKFHELTLLNDKMWMLNFCTWDWATRTKLCDYRAPTAKKKRKARKQITAEGMPIMCKNYPVVGYTITVMRCMGGGGAPNTRPPMSPLRLNMQYMNFKTKPSWCLRDPRSHPVKFLFLLLTSLVPKNVWKCLVNIEKIFL